MTMRSVLITLFLLLVVVGCMMKRGLHIVGAMLSVVMEEKRKTI